MAGRQRHHSGRIVAREFIHPLFGRCTARLSLLHEVDNASKRCVAR